MTGAVEDFDGLCGYTYHWATSDQQVKCKYSFAHAGQHSWQKLEPRGGCCTISGPGLISHPVEKYTQKKRD